MKAETRFGFWAAIATTILTMVTFGIAVATPPLSGPFCQADCFVYPYTGIESRYPRDYIWMFPAMLMMAAYVALTASIYKCSPEDKKIFGLAGWSLALISAGVFLGDFFVQVSVVQPSLIAGETEGIALLTQFNPHGIFIVLEELGYLLMCSAFLFFVPVIDGKNKLDTTIRWILKGAFWLTVLSLAGISYMFGLAREYRFEVAAITINWTALIVLGVLLALRFKRDGIRKIG